MAAPSQFLTLSDGEKVRIPLSAYKMIQAMQHHGLTLQEALAKCEIQYDTWYRHLRRADVKKVIREMSNVTNISALMRAQQKRMQLLESEDGNVAMKAVTSIEDRMLGKAKTQVQVEGTVEIVTRLVVDATPAEEDAEQLVELSPGVYGVRDNSDE